ncbi:MAG: DUF5131 family protein, partial [Bacteroidaceae bacterium]|nr:DUF5131 family protein [Bacteroidaceae bacterium]
LSTDFFVEEADEWREEAWRIIRQRPDIVFRLLTKRASRIKECLPLDWGEGYENVLLQVTTENQKRADERLSILLDIPAKHKGFMAAPFIETGTVFVKEGKTYRIPDKRTQSLQAFKSGLSYKGKDIDFKLTNPEPGFFDMDSAGSPTMEAYTPFFREHCETCGSRMTCNGCSNCGNCDKELIEK